MLDRLVGRGPVRFWEYHVEGNDDALHVLQTANKLGDHGPWPWPLPIGGEAFLVDVDDDRRPCGHRTWIHHLVEVRGAQPQLFDRQRVPDTQGEQQQQQQRAGRPACFQGSANSCNHSLHAANKSITCGGTRDQLLSRRTRMCRATPHDERSPQQIAMRIKPVEASLKAVELLRCGGSEAMRRGWPRYSPRLGFYWIIDGVATPRAEPALIAEKHP